MAGETLNEYILVIGSLGMGLMTTLVVIFIFLYQKKIVRKETAYREIEKLLQNQEIKSAYYLIEGQEQERKRIASDIHDNVGNLLATLKIFSDLILQKELSPEQLRLNRKVNEITELVTSEIRKISHRLDSGIVQTFGFQSAVKQLAEAVEVSGDIVFTVVYEVIGPLDGESTLHLYRIVQELVTNTLKHAKASTIRLEIGEIDGDLTIIYEDNGVGFIPEIVKPGMGMQNIRSRVSHLQGEVKMQSSSNGSTFVIEIPIKK